MNIPPIKRLIVFPLMLAALLLSGGCNDQYFDRIDELQARLDALQTTCDQINDNLKALQQLIEAVQEKDMITGITEIKENGVSTGYKINFVNHAPVTISNGKDGSTPIISSMYDSETGNYYWTIQYGEGNVYWMLDPEGNRLLSTGILPHLAIRDGMWCYTLDGHTYVEIGKADGNPGDRLRDRRHQGQLRPCHAQEGLARREMHPADGLRLAAQRQEEDRAHHAYRRGGTGVRLYASRAAARLLLLRAAGEGPRDRAGRGEEERGRPCQWTGVQQVP